VGKVFFLLVTMLATNSRSEALENVEYGRAGDFSLRMDANIPKGGGPFPAVIIVHGGAWVAGDRRSTVQPLFEPLSAAGFAWFTISYRLANDIFSNGLGSALMLGAAIDDVRQAVSFVKAHAAEYRVDPARIALIGESAGGQLASMAALKPGPAGAVRAVVAFYTPSDLVTLARTSNRIPESVRRAVKGSPFEELLLAGLRDLSPINWVREYSPPFLLIHGTADTLVPIEQSKAMCEKIREAGATCDMSTVKGGGHGVRGWDAASLTTYKTQMIRWLEKELK
jgi:acetyl esterase